jgi:hypothetical protein
MHAGRLAAGIGGCLAEEDNPVRLVIRPDQSSLDPHGARPLAKFGKGRTDCRPFRRVNGVQQVAIKIAREVGIETEVAGHLRRPSHLAAGQIPLPGTYLPGFQRGQDIETGLAVLADCLRGIRARRQLTAPSSP